MNQVSVNGTNLFTLAEAPYYNADDPDSEKFSILKYISMFKRSDGKYKFKYYDETITNIWYQTSDPTTTEANTVTGYEAISIESTSHS